MEYFKTTNGFAALWVQNERCAWVVSIYPTMDNSSIKCEAGPYAKNWAKIQQSIMEPCTEAEFTEIYNRAIEHQRKYRKEATV